MAYKNKTAGIYSITNKVNGKIYIGSSRHLEERIARHKIHLNNGNHFNSHLQRSFNKHGLFNFDFKIIESCLINDLVEREQFWIDYYKSGSRKYGYNIKRDIVNVSHSMESRLKQSRSMLGKKKSPEECIRIKIMNSGSGNGMYGKPAINRKLSDRDCIEIDRLLMQGYTTNSISSIYNCSFQLISQLKTRKGNFKKRMDNVYKNLLLC